MTTLTIPAPSLVVLVGASGSGKSTFAARLFKPTEIIGSDRCRALVSDDESDQASTSHAFAVVHALIEARLGYYRMAVVDATNIERVHRKQLVDIARKHHLRAVLIVLDLPIDVCKTRNRERPGRVTPDGAVVRQSRALRQSLNGIRREGWHTVHILKTPAEVDDITEIARAPLKVIAHRENCGPFDIIGDVHGCHAELVTLLKRLGYQWDGDPAGPFVTLFAQALRHPDNRVAVFVGDLCDRGPHSLGVINLVLSMVEAKTALWVLGNHDSKFNRYLLGRDVQITHGLDKTVAEYKALSPEHQAAFKARYTAAAAAAPAHYVLDRGRLVVAHAGLRPEFIGRVGGEVRRFTLYGETTGEVDEFGLPERKLDWASDYRGRATIVYGHTPVEGAPRRIGKTVCIDTGCVFGGKLTALSWPEMGITQVPAARVYCEPVRRPVSVDGASISAPATDDADDLLDAEQLLGQRIIQTRLDPHIQIRAGHAAAAFEALVRWCVDPRWLIYLPPTMSPCEASTVEPWLEHPAEAFAYYRGHGTPVVVCQEKHMGSRAVLILCRDADVGEQRFGIRGLGCCYTRTGRRFFTGASAALERPLFECLIADLTAAGMWGQLETDWLALDCEIMPWNAKGEGLVKESFALPAVAARASLPCAATAIAAARGRGVEGLDADELRADRLTASFERYVQAYRAFCWPVATIADLRVAPFQLLAAEGRTFFDHSHDWHAALNFADPRLGSRSWYSTSWRVVDGTSRAEVDEATRWWCDLTAATGEGMVVKPRQPISLYEQRLVQPALKVRGHNYLRIIYGADYDEPDNLLRLRRRRIAGKKALAAKEFALGVEGLERFARRESLKRVHECAFGVLALESEPMDPRL